MKKRGVTKRMLGVSLASLFIGFTGSAAASGFQLFQYNGSSVGDVNAGAGASSLDASSNFTNAAGLVRMKGPQIIISANQVMTQAKFNGTSS
ncbi:MAG: hypothetical protein ACNA7Y_02985, partial [Gammaproteobacteria bacterium]